MPKNRILPGRDTSVTQGENMHGKHSTESYFEYMVAWMLSEGEFLLLMLIPQFTITLGLKTLLAITDTVAFGAPTLFASLAGVVLLFALALFAKKTRDYLREKKAHEEHELPGRAPSRKGLSYAVGVFWLVLGTVFFYGAMCGIACFVGSAIMSLTGISIATLTAIGVPGVIVAATSFLLWLWTSDGT